MGGILFMQDISKMDDDLSVDEIRKLIDEFIKCYMNVADRNSLLFAFEQLCELADRQSNTYTILDKNHQNKITDFIQNHVSDFDDYDVMDSILYIVVNMGLKNAFQYILGNRNKIKNDDVQKMIDECIMECGDTIDNPYNDLERYK